MLMFKIEFKKETKQKTEEKNETKEKKKSIRDKNERMIRESKSESNITNDKQD